MASMITYAPVMLGTERKSEPGPTPGERKIALQIDKLQRMAKREQESRWGANWVDEMMDYLALDYFPSTSAPSYRPRIILPETQFLLMSEATELTNDSPKTYISVNGKRDEPRERAFAANWKAGQYNNRIFEAVLWSQFCNPSPIQVGINPDARMGRGSVWIKARHPDSFFPDSHATDDRGWSYVIAEDWFYVDEVKRIWGERARSIRSSYTAEEDLPDEATGSGFDLSLELPPGPLRVDAPEGFEHRKDGPRVRVRYLWIKDYAREVVREVAGESTAEGLELVVSPLLKWKYPGGRFIAECQGFTLSDGPNWVPRLPEDDFGTFPFVGAWSMPHLKSYFGVPPVRYGKNAQDIAERLYTQLIENIIRTNNGQYFVPEDAGIDIDAFGGLPGEVLVFRGDKAPEVKWPNPIPAHMTQIPEALLQKCARYVGWTPERQGQVGQGNVSVDLYDASLYQSQSMLRMKARMLAETYTRLALMVFHLMCRFKTMEDRIRPGRGEKVPPAVWSPVPAEAEVDLELDDLSLDTISASMMKSLVLALGKSGAIPNKFMLQTLGVPNAEEMADEATRQQELAALSRLKRPR